MTPRKAQNRKKRQQYNQEEIAQSGDPSVAVRRLEAQLAQEKFFHEKACAEQQHEIRTLQGKVKNLERLKKTLQEKLEQSPNEVQEKLQREANDASKALKETSRKLLACQQQVEKLLRSNRGLKRAKDKLADQMMNEIENKDLKIKNLEEKIKKLTKGINGQNSTKSACNSSRCQNKPDMEMWNESDNEKQEGEQKPKEEIENRSEVTNQALEENKKHDLMTFFPSMHDAGKKQRDKDSPKKEKSATMKSSESDSNAKSRISESILRNVSNAKSYVSPENKTVRNPDHKRREIRAIIGENQALRHQDICHFYEVKELSGEDKNLSNSNEDSANQQLADEKCAITINEGNTASFLSTLVITNSNKGNNVAQADYISELKNLEAKINEESTLNSTSKVNKKGMPLSFGDIKFNDVSQRLPPGLNIFDPNTSTSEFDFFNEPYQDNVLAASFNTHEQKSAESSWQPVVKMASVNKLNPTKTR